MRWTVLGIVLVGITALFAVHQFGDGAFKPLGVDAFCPFGGVETLYSVISGGELIQRVAVSSLILLGGSVAVALVFRRSFCGQLCSLGALQGVFGSLGKRLLRRRPAVPKRLDRAARWLKYAVLAVFAVWTWRAGELVMRPYDPWAAWSHITSPELLTDLGVGAAVLGVALVGSLVYDRFFCKYLCPMGALLGIFSRLSFFRIRRDETACISCKRCDKACPMGVSVSNAEKVTSAECIACGECVNSCPVAGALSVSTPKKRRVPPSVITAIVVLMFALTIGASTLSGDFVWGQQSLSEAVKTSQEAGSASFDSSLIKGRMSMQEIIDATGIPAEAFTQKWGVPAEDLGKPMKDIAEQYGFEPEDVRVWVEEQLGQ